MKIYKHIILTSFLFFVFSISLNAQSISGIINDSEGLPLPGATIQNLNTLDGVSTDFDGKFSIDASLDDVLEISFIGFETFQLKISNLSDDFTIQLELGNELDEVVVSSFGFEKKTKALGYSVTQVEGDEMSRVKSTNPLQALRGKVAGVNISNNASGIKGSTRVVIRGSSSFNGSNQPLYIIDGISIQNEQLGTAGEWGGIDGGDGLSTINPDDIKSISVLKGGAAAALYGSRASNGVILITTKDGGLERQGLGVEISNQTIFTQINDNFNPQMSYGNGLLGVASTNSLDPFNSWGPKLSSGTKLYDNMNTLYDTGLAMTNSVAFTSNTEKGSTRVSFTNLEASDVIDTSELKRNSLNLTTVQNLSDKLTVKASIKYNETREKGNVVMGTSPASPNETIRNFTPEIDVRDYLGEFGNGTTDGINELLPSTSIYSTNPWFAKNNNPISVYRDRLLASTSIQYNINEYLYAKLQAGFDRNTNHFNNTTGQGGNLNFPGISFFPKGDLYQQTQTIKQHDADFFIGTNGINITNDFSFNGFIGTGTFAFESEAVGVLGRNTVIPGLLTIQNTENQAALYQYGKKQINSTYANAEFDYQDKIFLTVTARNDWFSTLSAVGKETPNNDLYGSASLSVILSDLVELPSFLSFAKLRGGFSQVAGGAGNPYSLSLTYGLIGQGHLGSPLGVINGGNIPNVTITPFQKDETEIGLDMKMFNNKLSLDIAYYENKTTGDIVNAATSRASGYTATTINLGEMTNQGVEILLRGTVIDKEDLSLDLSLNYANNQSNVVKTDENGNLLQIAVGSLFNSFIGAKEGEPFGVIYGTSFLRDDQGRVIHKLIDGVPIAQQENVSKVLGLGVAPTQIGFGGDLSYKNFSLYVFFEGKFGGSIISDTNSRMKQLGRHQITVPAGGREVGFTPDGVMDDGSAVPLVAGSDIQKYWNTAARFDIGEENVYTNDFIRISQLSLNYRFPQEVLQGTFIKSANVALVGNNLGFIFKDVPNIDPEAFNRANTNGQGVEGIGMPIGESLGLSINLKL